MNRSIQHVFLGDLAVGDLEVNRTKCLLSWGLMAHWARQGTGGYVIWWVMASTMKTIKQGEEHRTWGEVMIIHMNVVSFPALSQYSAGKGWQS